MGRFSSELASCTGVEPVSPPRLFSVQFESHVYEISLEITINAANRLESGSNLLGTFLPKC